MPNLLLFVELCTGGSAKTTVLHGEIADNNIPLRAFVVDYATERATWAVKQHFTRISLLYGSMRKERAGRRKNTIFMCGRICARNRLLPNP